MNRNLGLSDLTIWHDMFPASAGMNRMTSDDNGWSRGINVPRERGDEPGSPAVQSIKSHNGMFPASAGMNRHCPDTRQERILVPCSPRARG